MRIYNNPAQKLWNEICCRPVLQKEQLGGLIDSIFSTVQASGDQALLAYTEQFDGVKLNKVCLEPGEIIALARKTSTRLRRAIDNAYDTIWAFHAAQAKAGTKNRVETVPGVVCWREGRPIERVGLYVPGGSAPLISTVLMLGIPAQIAGCKNIILATPPNKDGSISGAICYAALKTGISKVITVGGAQAIASMAIGTQEVPKVDKIFGPGNQYVTAAKQNAVAYNTAIDMPAGPSEVLVLADKTAVPAFVAADLLSQAEHGPDSQVVLVTTRVELIKTIKAELASQLELLPRKQVAKRALDNSFGVLFADSDTAVDFVNAYAAEHVIVCTKNAKLIAKRIQNAGSVFLGNYAPESAGDYASGTNHTLPTNGWARSCGGVSVDSFVKQISFQTLTSGGLTLLAPTIKSLANAEGLTAHARAVSIRLNKSKL